MPGVSPDKTKVALVLMSFDTLFDDIYIFGIKEVLEKRGYRCIRVDEKLFQGQIIREIQKDIAESDLIIAEMTDKNPNVYYEVGYAHGLGKQPILITKQVNMLPFDLSGYKHIVYRGEIKTLRKELEKYLDCLERASSAIHEIIPDPTHLRMESKAVLTHLYKAGEDRPAAECAEKARGIYSTLNDLKFLDYVRFYGPLLPNTPIHLTDIGKEAARNLMEQPSNSQ